MKRNYKTIKWVLKQQIEKGTKTLWTWKKSKKENFSCIYKNYNDDLTNDQAKTIIEENITENTAIKRRMNEQGQSIIQRLRQRGQTT